MTRLSRPQRVSDYAYTKASPVKVIKADGTIEEKPAYDQRQFNRLVPDARPRTPRKQRQARSFGVPRKPPS